MEVVGSRRGRCLTQQKCVESLHPSQNVTKHAEHLLIRGGSSVSMSVAVALTDEA